MYELLANITILILLPYFHVAHRFKIKTILYLLPRYCFLFYDDAVVVVATETDAANDDGHDHDHHY